MPDFSDSQTNLQQARKDRAAADRSAFLAKERLRRIQREKAGLLRSAGDDSNELAALLDRESQARGVLDRENARQGRSRELEDRFILEFERFEDPREHIANLSDDYPLLLFPVRLEVRFKRIQGDQGVDHQLWVRIFPDDCSVDTFDDTLSEAEINRARNYWTNIWKAGTAGNAAVESWVENKSRGAWREFMGVFNAGRAWWIREHYQPVNAAAIPTRNHETDRILVIPTEVLPDPAQQAALTDYWSAVLLAGDNAQAIGDAFDALVAALGMSAEAAASLVDTYRPENLEPPLETPGVPPAIQVAFIQFTATDDQDSSLSAWTQAARVTTLPERFVLVAYQDGVEAPVINELGGSVRDPLIVGPDPSMDIEAVLRAEYGPEFDVLSEDEKAERYVDYLSQHSDTRWLFDFDEAVKAGMGFKVSVSQQQYDAGFRRLFVLGTKLSASADDGKELLETLIHNHHFGDSGFEILRQGTPTNNTDNTRSGHTDEEDADKAFEHYQSANGIAEDGDERTRLDGRWLADLLGIDAVESTLDRAPGYSHTDQSEARAMNTALWNATLGYFMESMLTPVFTEQQRNLVRWFLIHHVSGRGRIPAIRIGEQPYGILATSTISDLGWLEQRDLRFPRDFARRRQGMQQINGVLQTMMTRFRTQLDRVARVGAGNGLDAHEIVLKVLGLHATSVEFDQRYAESFAHHFNWLLILGAGGEALARLLELDYQRRGLGLLEDHGYEHDDKLDPKIPVLEKFFLTREHDVRKPLIDDKELSEINRIRPYTETGENYITWLIDKARTAHGDIRNQRGFAENRVPHAILYDMLRHAVNLSFAGTGLNLYKNASIIDEPQASLLRMDADFIGIREQPAGVESKWDLIYRADDRVTGGSMLMVDHISTLVRTQVVNSQTKHLHELLEALEQLEDVPTARLERAFVEHLDLCTYRLDAWLLGLVNAQLHAMRYSSGDDGVRQGVYLGAFGWLEDVRADDRTLTPAEVPEDLRPVFDPDGSEQPVIDDRNGGYIHAPSVNHGLTAAVLRNAYISNADADEAEPFKVNLSSERVRLALSIIEGMQQGQSLGALLGYQLERQLHDRTDEEMDIYIYELRKVFSLRSNLLTTTQIREGRIAASPEDEERNDEEVEELSEEKAVSKIEARNVVNGLALLEHIRTTGEERYPFGFATGVGPNRLLAADAATSSIIDSAVDRLRSIRDAVSDLAMAESVHQVVQGNYERASGTLETYSKGHYPHLPDVVQSQGSGTGLTHRFGLHLPSGLPPAAGDTPRALAEPAINAWIGDLLPNDLSTVACTVEYTLPSYDPAVADTRVSLDVSAADLELSPIDLLYLIDIRSGDGFSALDELIVDFVHRNETPRPDVEVTIRHTQTFDIADGKLTFFEISPLIRSLREILLSARPLTPADVMLQNEGSKKHNASITLDRNRMVDARQRIVDVVGDIKTDIVDVLDPLIVAEDFDATLDESAAILAQADAVTSAFQTHLRALGEYGIPESGFGWVRNRIAAIRSSVNQRVADYRDRWVQKQSEYDRLINVDLPAAPDDETRIGIFVKAERAVSTTLTVPRPDVAAYPAVVAGKRSLFDGKLGDLVAFIPGTFLTFQQLLTELATIDADLGDFDPEPFELSQVERDIVVLVEDIHRQSSKLHDVLIERTDRVQAILADEDAAGSADAKIKLLTEAAALLFGEDFKILPDFTFNAQQSDELKKCHDDLGQLLHHQTSDKGTEFPVDDWLYGVARVREKLAAWENVAVLAEGFKVRAPLSLTPFQLPYMENDSWLGLEHPPGYTIDGDKLLYTAFAPAFDSSQPQRGLLVDEWTEVIPATSETTGLAFHYDQPNSEPPQSLLLVTPPRFRGAWQWTDVLATLHETLDLAQLRAIEPDHVDRSEYAPFLPATVAAATSRQVTMAMNYGVEANQIFQYRGQPDA